MVANASYIVETGIDREMKALWLARSVLSGVQLQFFELLRSQMVSQIKWHLHLTDSMIIFILRNTLPILPERKLFIGQISTDIVLPCAAMLIQLKS